MIPTDNSDWMTDLMILQLVWIDSSESSYKHILDNKCTVYAAQIVNIASIDKVDTDNL